MTLLSEAIASSEGKTVVISNGANTCQKLSLSTLYEMLEQYTLDPIFEKYGIISKFEPAPDRSPEIQELKGATSFSGNFLNISSVFNIITTDTKVIERLTGLITKNIKTQKYQLVASPIYQGYRYVNCNGTTRLASPAVVKNLKAGQWSHVKSHTKSLYEFGKLGGLRFDVNKFKGSTEEANKATVNLEMKDKVLDINILVSRNEKGLPQLNLELDKTKHNLCANVSLKDLDVKPVVSYSDSNDGSLCKVLFSEHLVLILFRDEELVIEVLKNLSGGYDLCERLNISYLNIHKAM